MRIRPGLIRLVWVDGFCGMRCRPHLIASAVFGFVQGGIRLRKQIRRFGSCFAGHNASTECDVEALSFENEADFAKALPNIINEVDCICQRAFRQNDAKLFTAISADNIMPSQALA